MNSKHNAYDEMSTCRICGKPVYWYQVYNSWQKVHSSCAKESEQYDFEYSFENFNIKLHSDVLSPTKLKKIIRSLPSADKQNQRRK